MTEKTDDKFTVNVIGQVIPGKAVALKVELTPEQAEQCIAAGIFYFLGLGALSSPPIGAFSKDEWQSIVDRATLTESGPTDPSEVN